MPTLQEEFEERVKFRQDKTNDARQIFDTRGAAGNNPEKLARILSGWSMIVDIMGWSGRPAQPDGTPAKPAKPLSRLVDFLAQYQGSVDAKYHNDYKDIQIAEEIERKRSERKGISIMQQ